MTVRSGPGVDGKPERIHIGDDIYRHHLLAPHPVDQKIARSGEHKPLGIIRKLLLGCLENAGINILPEIGDVGAVLPVVLKIMHKDRLQRQNLADEPRRYLVHAHGPALPLQAVAVASGCGCFSHSPRNPPLKSLSS